MRSFSLFLVSQRLLQQALLANSVTFGGFILPIKLTPLSALILGTMNLETFWHRNTSPNAATLMPGRFFSNAFIILLQLVTPSRAISQTFMRNEKDNRKRLQPSHTRLPPYIISFGQCITS